MSDFRILLYTLLLSLALLSGSARELWALETSSAENKESSENVLNRLIGISNQLSTLNGRLQSELQDFRRNSRELQTMLETSRMELDVLRQELEVLHSSSTELLTKAESSQTESAELRATLRKAESSLLSLDLSFEAYRKTAEGRIKNLERDSKLWKWGCIAAGVLAIGFGAAYAAGR